MSVAKSTGLLRALKELISDARLSVVDERPWHSITFVGTQICLSADIAVANRREMASDLAKLLPEHQFDLCDRSVADIAVTDCASDDGETRLVIHALLLDD